MAKSKKNKAPEAEADIMYDGIPGADVLSEEEASKNFEADLNFEDGDVEFPKEDEIEEIEESELTADTEEAEEAEPEEAETETVEAESDTEEASGEETVLDSNEGDTQEPEGTVPEAVVETKEPMIPKSRFDEVLAKQKALAKKLEEATNPIEVISESPDYNFDAKEVEYQEAILNGEPEKATALRSEIRNAERQQMMFEVQNRMGKTVQQSTEAMDLQRKAHEIATAHPQLDETSSTFDEAVAQEVLDLRDAFIVQGFAGADALEKATKYVVGSPTPAPKKDIVGEKIVEKKKVANTTKKIEAADSQPPAMKGKNKTDKKIDLNVLSTDEFDALPEETLRRMRGDFG